MPLDKDSEVEPGLGAAIEDLEAVEGKAEGPGEVAGAALRFAVVLTNGTDQEVPLDTTVVNLYYGGKQTPGSPLSGPGVAPLPANIAAKGTARGVFVFAVPVKSRDEVLITVDYSVGTPVTAFRGKAPR